jgi:hypothetical protein
VGDTANNSLFLIVFFITEITTFLQPQPTHNAPITEQHYDPHTYHSRENGGGAYEDYVQFESSAHRLPAQPPQPLALAGYGGLVRAPAPYAQPQQRGGYTNTHARPTGVGAPASISQVLASSEASFFDFDSTFFDDQQPLTTASTRQQQSTGAAPPPSDTQTTKLMLNSLVALMQQRSGPGVCKHARAL